MDLVEWSADRFRRNLREYQAFAKSLDLVDPYFLPMSALLGDNVVDKGDNLTVVQRQAAHGTPRNGRRRSRCRSRALPYAGSAGSASKPGFSRVCRHDLLRRSPPGDEVISLPSGVGSTVDRIVTFDGDLDVAGPGRAVTITLADEIDVSRGDLSVKQGTTPLRSHDIDAMIVWMSETELETGRQYLLQSSNGTSNADVTSIRHRVDINTMEHQPASKLALNDIALCSISSDRELLFDPYVENRHTGSFILIDRLTNATVAAGMIKGASSGWDRAPETTLTRQISEITAKERAVRFGQQPCTVLLTGLTAAGKSTLATALERELFDRGKVSIRLDGENVRMGISRDLGFTAQERSENLRRVSEVARLANSQGIIAIAALVAPNQDVRQRSRDLIGEGFVEIFVDTPIEVCRQRDPGGLYEAADRGEIPLFPGVSATYERPSDADLTVDTSVQSVDECVSQIVKVLVDHGFLRG